MYSPKDIIDIATAIIKGYSARYDRFLDDMSAEWARHISEKYRERPVGPDADDVKAQERFKLWREIMLFNEINCRRDISSPDWEFEQQRDKYNCIIELRKNAKRPDPHTAILGAIAHNLMLHQCFEDAKRELSLAVQIVTDRNSVMGRREMIRFKADYVRCLYMTKEFDLAVILADECRRIAENINLEEEKRAFCAQGPGSRAAFVPVAVYAYFIACDARIHHAAWEKDFKLQEEFNWLWDESIRKFSAPRIWQTPLKIAVLSDRTWVKRTNSYIIDIAELLYKELGNTRTSRIIRRIRSDIGGFNLTLPNGIGFALSLLCFLTALNIHQSITKFTPNQFTQERVEEIYGDTGVKIDLTRLRETMSTYVGKINVSRIENPTVESMMLRELSHENFHEESLRVEPVQLTFLDSEADVTDL